MILVLILLEWLLISLGVPWWAGLILLLLL